MEFETKERSGFVAIVGRPNVGKSSILNRLLGQKLSIVSCKPQTTRNRIMGVLTENNTQLVFIDTPGLTKPHNRLDNYMIHAIQSSVAGVDTALLVVDAGRPLSNTEKDLSHRFKDLGIPAVLALNKVDTLHDNKELLLNQLQEYSAIFDFDAVIPCSAQTGENLDALKTELRKLACTEGYIFDEDTLTDQPERVIAAEFIREKMLRLLDRELPHCAAVLIERMQERENSEIIDIDATIYCERDSHKGIIIGKGGSMLKKIGTYARQDMERFFGTQINLTLWVKVKEDWRNRENILRSLGYDESHFDE